MSAPVPKTSLIATSPILVGASTPTLLISSITWKIRDDTVLSIFNPHK